MNWEAQYEEWKQCKLSFYRRRTRSLAAAILSARTRKNRYSNKAVQPGGEHHIYWFQRYEKAEASYRKDLQYIGARINVLRSQKAKDNMGEVLARLTGMGVELSHIKCGLFHNKPVKVEWDVHVRGLAMCCWFFSRKLASATCYSSVKFADCSLDIVLRDGR
jgi:hypothetical protein